MKSNISMPLKIGGIVLLAIGSLAIGFWIEWLRGMTPLLLFVSYFLVFRTEGIPDLKVDGGMLYLHQGFGRQRRTVSKEIRIGIKAIVQWDGYEGKLMDLIWNDGEIWSLTDGFGVDADTLRKVLDDLGLKGIPVKKEHRVFRPPDGKIFA